MLLLMSNELYFVVAIRCLAEAPQLTTTSELDAVFPKSTLVRCQDGCSLNGSSTTNYLSQCNASAMWSKLIPCQREYYLCENLVTCVYNYGNILGLGNCVI